MQTLYRKYRPQLWSEVFGQNDIKNILTNQILTNKISHAYIFSGSRGIGKTTFARLFSKTLNCKNRKENEIEPCNHCESCISINNSNDFNIIEIDAASYTGVDNIRELRNIAKIPASEKSYKIFIIDEAHMLSKQAFNALLKILEEPPERVIFILATTEINKILDTILSRCQIFNFKKATLEEILQDMKFICEKEGITIDEEVFIDIAKKSLGGFRDAESLLGQIISSTNESNITFDLAKSLISRGNNDIIFEFALNIIENKVTENLILIEKIKELEVSFPVFILDLIEYFRKILIYKYNNSVMENWSNLEDVEKENIVNYGLKLDFNRLNLIIRKLIDAKLDLEKSDILELPLELTIIELAEKITENKVTITENPTPRILKKIEQNFSNNDLNDILDTNSKEDIKITKSEEVGNEEHDIAKKERLLKKFGIKRDGEEIQKIENTMSFENAMMEVKEETKTEQQTPSVSVLDLLKEEFKDELVG